LADHLTEAEAASIVGEYSSLIRPIAQEYARWALENLGKETHTEHHQGEPVSTVEQTRITRALYRFHLCCRMFGARDDWEVWRSDWLRQSKLSTTKFMLTLEPWEVEQFASVYAFIRAKYEQVFDDIQSDVHPDNPRFDDQRRPPTPDGAFELEGCKSCSFDRMCHLHPTNRRAVTKSVQPKQIGGIP
jgi:predicted ATPase